MERKDLVIGKYYKALKGGSLVRLYKIGKEFVVYQEEGIYSFHLQYACSIVNFMLCFRAL